MKKKIALAALPIMASTAPCLPVLASDTGGGSANSSVVTAMTTVANDMLATGQSIIPVALGVVGLSMVVVFGIKIFKRIANK